MNSSIKDVTDSKTTYEVNAPNSLISSSGNETVTGTLEAQVRQDNRPNPW